MKRHEKFGQIKKLFHLLSNILSWAAFAILIIIAGLLIFYVVSVKIYASRGEKYEPPISLYTIISPSMEPTIKIYDVIVNVKVKDFKKINEGDVITFISTSSLTPGMTITHRVDEVITSEDGIKFRTKGDNNLSADGSLVSENDILGKVAFKVPQLGRVQFLLASKYGWLLFIVLPALCIIIYDILKVFKLVGVKNKVNKINQKEEVDIDQKEKEQERKEALKNKLKPDNKTKKGLKYLPVIAKNINKKDQKKLDEEDIELHKDVSDEDFENLIANDYDEAKDNNQEKEEDLDFTLPKLK